jgi:hypothetical protein
MDSKEGINSALVLARLAMHLSFFFVIFCSSFSQFIRDLYTQLFTLDCYALRKLI